MGESAANESVTHGSKGEKLEAEPGSVLASEKAAPGQPKDGDRPLEESLGGSLDIVEGDDESEEDDDVVLDDGNDHNASAKGDGAEVTKEIGLESDDDEDQASTNLQEGIDTTKEDGARNSDPATAPIDAPKPNADEKVSVDDDSPSRSLPPAGRARKASVSKSPLIKPPVLPKKSSPSTGAADAADADAADDGSKTASSSHDAASIPGRKSSQDETAMVAEVARLRTQLRALKK